VSTPPGPRSGTAATTPSASPMSPGSTRPVMSRSRAGCPQGKWFDHLVASSNALSATSLS
jgi:hypothetical protein